jgi:CheY-like chemotaxis protein
MVISKNIYLADDDCDDVEFFKDALNEITFDFHLTISSNGQELLDTLHSSSLLPDIIFIDLNMPIMDGFEALSLIKTNEVLNSIPTVIYSTSSNMNHITKAYELGASSYFKKPSDFKSLKNELEKVLLIDWKNFIQSIE